MRSLILSLLLLMVLGVSPIFAETIKWIGANQTGFDLTNSAQDWFEPTNWDLGRIPKAGDDVEIKNPVDATLWYITLTNATPHLNSLTMHHTYPSGSPHYRIYVRVRGWETKVWADTISIGQGSNIQACDSFGNNESSNRVWIVGNTMTLAAHGEDPKAGFLSAVGYKINNGPGYKCYPEEYTGGLSSYAAAHGGMGLSSAADCSTLFQTYGSAEWPLQPGTGGPTRGNPGGGAILIELTGDLIVNGWIGANTVDPGTSNMSLGSGGSVCITCRTLTGSGRISAAGEAYTYGGQFPWAGGGRVAVHYNPEEQTNSMANCKMTISACGGSYGYGTSTLKYHTGLGGSGTVWFPDRLFLDQQRPYRVAGVLANLPLDEGKLNIDGDIEIKNGLLAFNESVAVKITGSSSATGTYTCQNGFDFEAENSSLEIGGDLSLLGANVRFRAGGALTVAGDLTLASDTNKRIYQGGGLWLTASGGEMGEPTMTVDVGGDLTVNPYTMVRPICDPQSGSIVTFKAKNINLCSNSLAYAEGVGFATSTGPGSKSGYGGTHAGKGAVVSSNNTQPYGVERLPMAPGSGGNVGMGGGVIYMVAEKMLTCNGTVTAAASATSRGQSGWNAGAGGSVVLLCKILSGDAGVISAAGGDAYGGSGYAYGGGGGRIAIRRGIDRTNHENLSLSVVGGTAGSTVKGSLDPAEDGTIYWGSWKNGLQVLLK